jgi:hypothetical protein
MNFRENDMKVNGRHITEFASKVASLETVYNSDDLTAVAESTEALKDQAMSSLSGIASYAISANQPGLTNGYHEAAREFTGIATRAYEIVENIQIPTEGHSGRLLRLSNAKANCLRSLQIRKEIADRLATNGLKGLDQAHTDHISGRL